MNRLTGHVWSAFDQGWYDALTTAERFYAACGRDWAGRLPGRFFPPPKLRRNPPDGLYGVAYHTGYTTVTAAIHARIDAHASLQTLTAETAAALAGLRARHDAAVAAALAEAEAITKAAADEPRDPPS